MAIAFDAASDAATASATSLTFAHTCTGDSLMLILAVLGSTTNIITGATYNSVAMTQVSSSPIVDTTGTGPRYLYLFYLVGPSTGANNIVISASGSGAIRGAAASYTGVNQVAPEADASQVGTATAVTASVTVATDQAWLVMGARGQGGTIAAGSGTTERADDAVSVVGIYDSNGGKAVGSQSLAATATTHSTNMIAIIASIAPAATGKAIPIFKRPTRTWRR